MSEPSNRNQTGRKDAPRHPFEVEKYVTAYQYPSYRMGGARMAAAREDLSLLSGSLLDVGCGRGEVLDMAQSMGLGPVKGTEVVPSLIDGDRVVFAEAQSLPFEDGAFDSVTMYDVLEHIPEGDSEAVCKELQRVARRAVIITASNLSHVFQGVELHINRKPYAVWDQHFNDWFSGKVQWVRGSSPISDTWRVFF